MFSDSFNVDALTGSKSVDVLADGLTTALQKSLDVVTPLQKKKTSEKRLDP